MALGAGAGDVKSGASGEERNEAGRRQPARSEAAGSHVQRQPIPAPRAPGAWASPGRACARGLAVARGPRSAARLSAGLAGAGLSLPLASARLPSSPGWRRHPSWSPATAVAAAAIQDAHFTFPLEAEDAPCTSPGEIAPARLEEPWPRGRKSGLLSP